MFQCAHTHGFSVQPRMVNGIPSNPEDFPFYVIMDAGHGTCGGSLISDRYQAIYSQIFLLYTN